MTAIILERSLQPTSFLLLFAQVMMRKRSRRSLSVRDPGPWLTYSWKRRWCRCPKPVPFSSLALRTSKSRMWRMLEDVGGHWRTWRTVENVIMMLMPNRSSKLSSGLCLADKCTVFFMPGSVSCVTGSSMQPPSPTSSSSSSSSAASLWLQRIRSTPNHSRTRCSRLNNETTALIYC